MKHLSTHYLPSNSHCQSLYICEVVKGCMSRCVCVCVWGGGGGGDSTLQTTYKMPGRVNILKED